MKNNNKYRAVHLFKLVHIYLNNSTVNSLYCLEMKYSHFYLGHKKLTHWIHLANSDPYLNALEKCTCSIKFLYFLFSFRKFLQKPYFLWKKHATLKHIDNLRTGLFHFWAKMKKVSLPNSNIGCTTVNVSNWSPSIHKWLVENKSWCSRNVVECLQLLISSRVSLLIPIFILTRESYCVIFVIYFKIVKIQSPAGLCINLCVSNLLLLFFQLFLKKNA